MHRHPCRRMRTHAASRASGSPAIPSVFPGNVSLPAAGLVLHHRKAPDPRRARERESGRSSPELLTGRCDPGDLDVADAYLTGEPGGPPDHGPGCFHGRRGIARLALDRDGGLIPHVPAHCRPDQRMPAGKRYRILERPPSLVGERRIQRRDHADGELVRAQLSRRTGGGWSPADRGPIPGTGPTGPGCLCGPGRSRPPRRGRPSLATGKKPDAAAQTARLAPRTQPPSAAPDIPVTSPALTMLRPVRLVRQEQANRWAGQASIAAVLGLNSGQGHGTGAHG
jgi:hypothetical protein